MFKLIKWAIFGAFVAGFIWFGSRVPLGNHTLFGHIQRIWKSDETQDLVKGTKEAARPAIEKVKRGVEAGVDEARKNAPRPRPEDIQAAADAAAADQQKPDVNEAPDTPVPPKRRSRRAHR